MTTETDTPSGEPGPLNLDTAADAFNAFLTPPAAEEPKVDTEIDAKDDHLELVKKASKDATEPAAEDNAQEEGDDAPITLEVDGKQVTLTKAELAEAYKSGLRQSDYSRKTEAVAEQRKAAEAEIAKAQQERQSYAVNLQNMAARLEGALEEQAKTDWNALLESDPVEFLKQKHLFDQRQAALHQNRQEMHKVQEQTKAEQAEAMKSHLAKQQEELLAKLPSWKDEAKAKSERDALKSYLVEQGYSQEDVAHINDHKAVILGRKAMLYDQMIAKAKAAEKKVQNLPTKVERPGTASDRNPLDGRTKAVRDFNKNPTLDSMANAFANLL